MHKIFKRERINITIIFGVHNLIVYGSADTHLKSSFFVIKPSANLLLQQKQNIKMLCMRNEMSKWSKTIKFR